MVHRNISHGEAKKAQTEKADKSEFWAFIQHKNKES